MQDRPIWVSNYLHGASLCHFRYHQITVRAVETCVDDVEVAVLLLQKASLARQARDAAQSPKIFSPASSSGGGLEELSQYSSIVSEASLQCSLIDFKTSRLLSRETLSDVVTTVKKSRPHPEPALLTAFYATQGELSSDDPSNSDRNSDSDNEAAGLRSDGSSGERDPLDRRETLVCNRLEAVMRAMAVLVESRLEGRSTEKLVSSASRLFRIMTKVRVFLSGILIYVSCRNALFSLL